METTNRMDGTSLLNRFWCCKTQCLRHIKALCGNCLGLILNSVKSSRPVRLIVLYQYGKSKMPPTPRLLLIHGEIMRNWSTLANRFTMFNSRLVISACVWYVSYLLQALNSLEITTIGYSFCRWIRSDVWSYWYFKPFPLASARRIPSWQGRSHVFIMERIEIWRPDDCCWK